MNKYNYLNSNINDLDIDKLEGYLGFDIKFDVKRREAIKSMDNLKLQALPGTGKTTIILAKLTLLVSKWTSKYKGICVLSHTNVAKDEINKRLKNSETANKILSNPHFVDTIHSFYSRFIFLPWLKSFGIEIKAIDTEIATSHRWRRLSHSAKFALTQKFKDKYNLEYSGNVGVIKISMSNKSKTHQEVIKVIRESILEGIVTYNEILIFSKYIIQNNPKVTEALSNKFPFVMIDEAQDIDELQQTLIDSSFNNSTIQYFGDWNQQIFENDHSKVHNSNKEPDINIVNSKRFSNDIANLCKPMVMDNSNLTGDNNSFLNVSNTIILFKKDSTPNVLEEFANLVLSTFDNDVLNNYKDNGIHALGFIHRKNEETKEKHFPKGIFDYYPSYDPIDSTRNNYYQFFSEYLLSGFQSYQESGNYIDYIEKILMGIKHHVNLQGSDPLIEHRFNIMDSFINLLNDENTLKFRKYLLMIQEFNPTIIDEFKKITEIVFELLSLFNFNNLNKDYFTYYSKLISINENSNIYNYVSNNNRNIKINLNSIHSAKGQTHLATLVLDSYYYSHCLASLFNKLTLNKDLTQRDNYLLKTHFVAMTRPMGLLCLAIPIDKIKENTKTYLRDMGWNFIEI